MKLLFVFVIACLSLPLWAQDFVGTSGDDVLVGSSGDDTFQGGDGSDEIYGQGGDDTITISGKTKVFIDTIYGGTGVDELVLNYPGISRISDFVASREGELLSFLDSNGSRANFKDIESITVGGNSYLDIFQGRSSATTATVNTWGEYADPGDFVVGGRDRVGSYHNNVITSALYSVAGTDVQLYQSSLGKGSNFTIPSLQTFGWDTNTTLSIKGTKYNDVVSDRNESSHSGSLNINTGDGVDIIALSTSRGADSADAGSGDDFVFVSARSPNEFTNDVSLKGGKWSRLADHPLFQR